MAKYSKYQDYVIKNGNFIGEFEQMYKDYSDPWGHISNDDDTHKHVCLHWIKKLKAKRIIEVGSGLGVFSNRLNQIGCDVLGIEISKTAVAKASKKYPACKFLVGDILDFPIYETFKPDAVILAEVSWYVLDKLKCFLDHMRENFGDVFIVNLLCMYPSKLQKYGRDYFTELPELLDFFGMIYLESGEISSSANGTAPTYFIGKWE